MNIESLYALFVKQGIVSTDTRKIEPGSIFFALKGPNFNANTFASQALEKGASYSVVDEEDFATNERCILVDDVLKTLQLLAAYHRKQLKLPVIAIVGSNGKTTTKELITSVLSTTFNTWATPGNLNNHIGLPLTLLQLTHEHEAAVIEMGANHIGENAELCEIAQPDLGLVTNNGMDHLEGFGDIEGVAKSNSELYYFLLKTGGLAFVNAHDEWLVRMSSRLERIKTYAANTEYRDIKADYEGYASALQPEIHFTAENINGHSVLSGDYNFDNIMAAFAIGRYLGVSAENCIKGIAGYYPKNNRSQWIKTDKNHVFMDAYNANPSSMEAALKNFALMNNPEKTVIMGDMFEMGDYASSEHQRMVDLCLMLGFKNVLLVGKDFAATTGHPYQRFITTEAAGEYLKQNNISDSAIFIKGSRGMKLETLLTFI